MVGDSFIVEDAITDTIKRLRPNIVVKGREYLNLENDEDKVLGTFGGRLVFILGVSCLFRPI